MERPTIVKKYFRLNRQITAPKLRVLDEGGKQIGIKTTEEALRLAWDQDLDLVEIAPEANPPVAKILDFKKFLYQEKRKEKKARAKTKEVEIKELRVGPFIARHDLDTRLDQARDFFREGNHVKITVKFAGRQMGHTEFGFELLKKIRGELSELAEVGREERLEGRNLTMLLTPRKGKKPGLTAGRVTENAKSED